MHVPEKNFILIHPWHCLNHTNATICSLLDKVPHNASVKRHILSVVHNYTSSRMKKSIIIRSLLVLI